jgi:hypothetical protein
VLGRISMVTGRSVGKTEARPATQDHAVRQLQLDSTHVAIKRCPTTVHSNHCARARYDE